MDDSRTQVLKLLDRIDETYWGPEERAMIDEALTLTQDIADEPLEYGVRMRLTASAAHGGDTDTLLSSFAWCLAHHDADPQTFPNDIGNSANDLMWHYKWMVGALDSSPIFENAAIETMLDDMETHYLKAGLGMSGVLTARLQHAWATGRLDEAKQLRDRLLATPRDDHSHCDACSRSELAGFAAETGDEAGALRLVDEIVDGGFTCGEEPEHALSRSLVAMMHAGRLDDARSAHVRSYRLARDNPDNIAIVGDNMVFCAITGNEARGLAMAERHLGWLVHDALNEAGQLDMLIAVASVLEAVTRAGYGDQVVRMTRADELALFFGERSDPWTAAELVTQAWAAAGWLAAAFDERNGNAYVSGRIAKAMKLLDEHYDVPISSDAFLDAPPPPVTEPTDADGWFRRARDWAASGLAERANDAARTALETADETLRPEALALLIRGLVAEGDETAATATLPDRIEALRTIGQDIQAGLEERAGLAMFGRTSSDDAAALEAELERLQGTPGPELADVALVLASVLAATDETGEHFDRVVGLLEQSVAVPDSRPGVRVHALQFLADCVARSDLPRALELLTQALAIDLSDGDRAGTLRTRARVLGAMERFDEAVRDADEATRINATLRLIPQTASSATLAGDLLMDARRPEEALTRFRYALRETDQLEDPAIGVRFRYGRALFASGHPLEAAEAFGDVLRAETDGDAPTADRADTLSWLGRAYASAEHYGSAIGCYRDAADLYDQAEDFASAAQMCARSGDLLTGFEEYDDAFDVLRHGLELAEKAEDDRGAVMHVLDRLAWARVSSGDERGLEDLDRALSIAEADETWMIADLTDTRARCLAQLDRFPDAVATFLRAADGFADADDLPAAARADFMAGVILADHDDPRSAAPTLVSAWDRVNAAISQGAELGGMRTSIALKLGDVREAMGDAAGAADIRSQVEP